MTKKIKSIRLIKQKDIKENFDGIFSEVNEQSIDSDNLMIKKVCLFGTRESKNNRIYQDKAIESLAVLANGVKCFINHPTKSEIKERDGVRDLRDWVGIYSNSIREGEKVFGDLVCREEYWDLVKDIAMLQPKNVGNSINARVKVYQDDKGMESVVDVDSLRSVDLVSSAATTTSLFESAIEENLKDNPDVIFLSTLESRINDRFKIIMVEEGIIQDKIDNQKIIKDINDVSYMANDLISDVLYNKELKINDKKSKIMAIFDDLDKEIKKRLSGIKEGEKKMEKLTMEILKSEYPELVKNLIEEVKEEEDNSKIKDEVEILKVQVQEKTDSISDKDKEIEDKDKAIKDLKEENQGLKMKLDEKELEEKVAAKNNLITEFITKAELPKDAVTEVFMNTLKSIENKTDGENTVTVEEQVKQLIEDRKAIIKKGSGKIKNSGDEFIVDTKESKKDEKVDDKDVDDFVGSIKK